MGKIHLAGGKEAVACSRTACPACNDHTPRKFPRLPLFRGPCTYDVRTEGGGGLKNCPILRTNSSDRLREMRTRGRGESKIPKILRTSYVHGPLICICARFSRKSVIAISHIKYHKTLLELFTPYKVTCAKSYSLQICESGNETGSIQ